MTTLLLAAAAFAYFVAGLDEVRLEWSPADWPDAPPGEEVVYQACAHWVPDGAPVCSTTTKTHATIPFPDPDAWTCLAFTIEVPQSINSEPKLVEVINNGNRMDVDGDCRVGLPDLLEIIRSIGDTAPGMPGVPTIVVEQ